VSLFGLVSENGSAIRVYILGIDERRRSICLSITAIDHPPVDPPDPQSQEAVTNLGALLRKSQR
jgi:hypothetical protein